LLHDHHVDIDIINITLTNFMKPIYLYVIPYIMYMYMYVLHKLQTYCSFTFPIIWLH